MDQMTGPAQPGEGIAARYAAAVLAQDVDAFMALYDADVRVFDTWEKPSHDGAAAWRAVVTAWLGSLGTERVVVSFEQLQTTAGGELALCHAFVGYAAVSADGQKLRAMKNRLTWVLKRVDGAWLIIHEHTSAPADPQTGKVMLG